MKLCNSNIYPLQAQQGLTSPYVLTHTDPEVVSSLPVVGDFGETVHLSQLK